MDLLNKMAVLDKDTRELLRNNRMLKGTKKSVLIRVHEHSLSLPMPSYIFDFSDDLTI